MNRQKIILATSVGAIAIAYWLLVQQPARQAEAARADQALLASGMQLYRDQRYEEAVAVFKRIHGESGRAAKARYYQGSALIMLQDYEAGAEQLEQSLSLDGSNAETRFALGVVYYKMGNLQLARGYFASVLQIEPQNDQDRARIEEAAGLMDIMARFERQQASAPAAASDADEKEEPGTGN